MKVALDRSLAEISPAKRAGTARTEVIKSVVVLALVETLRDNVCTRRARYEAPRCIEFMDALPMITTRKIMRKTLRERERV